MIRYFKKPETLENVDVLNHCVEKIKANKNVKIFIGTDSQNSARKTRYITVIVFRSEIRGASFIFKEVHVEKIRDRFTRLFKECELSLEVAEWLKENSSIHIEAIELDYNGKKKTESTNVIKPARGWVESLGYRAMVKPETLIAVRAADHLLKID